MFDPNFYNLIYGALHDIVNRNQHRLPQGLPQEILNTHNTSRGITPQAQSFYTMCENSLRSSNMGQFQNQDHLFKVVGGYLDMLISRITPQNQYAHHNTGMMSGGYGGGPFAAVRQQQQHSFGAGGFTTTGGNQNNNTGGFRQAPAAQAAPVQTQPAAVVVETTPIMVSTNPLDALSEKGTDLTAVREAAYWNHGTPKDDSIVFMSQEGLKTGDGIHVIHVGDAFCRTYHNKPMDVVREFFDTAPDRFLGEHFITRVFYNHVEELQLPTREFEDIRTRFIEWMRGKKPSYAYTAISNILDGITRGPSNVMSNYLVKHINRALELSAGYKADPEDRIAFTELEDLETILGSNFSHPILNIPESKEKISQIVMTAIINAMTAYSEVMFTSGNDGSFNAMKTSPAFPFSIPGVYSNKNMIPFSGSEASRKMSEVLRSTLLADKTYVRSIRSVIITNTMGMPTLVKPQKLFGQLSGTIPMIFSKFILPHNREFNIFESRCTKYNELAPTRNLDEEYTAYISDPEKYHRDELSKFKDMDPPTLPVDQHLFCIQYKQDPQDFLMALDIGTVMDGDRLSVYFKKSKLRDLSLV